MALFDHTADRLARGPAVLFPADPADGMAEAILRYDPQASVKSDRFVFGNGVQLHGPVTVTPELARQAGLPAGLTAGYYAAIVEGGTSRSRPDSLKWQDAERLIRGLAARLGGTVHDERPPMDLRLRASVYSGHELPAGQVIEVLQPYTSTGELVVEADTGVSGAYYLVTKQEPVFFVAYWPSRLSRSRLALPPPARRRTARQGALPLGPADHVPGGHRDPRDVPAGRRGSAGTRPPRRAAWSSTPTASPSTGPRTCCRAEAITPAPAP